MHFLTSGGISKSMYWYLVGDFMEYSYLHPFCAMQPFMQKALGEDLFCPQMSKQGQGNQGQTPGVKIDE